MLKWCVCIYTSSVVLSENKLRKLITHTARGFPLMKQETAFFFWQLCLQFREVLLSFHSEWAHCWARVGKTNCRNSLVDAGSSLTHFSFHFEWELRQKWLRCTNPKGGKIKNRYLNTNYKEYYFHLMCLFQMKKGLFHNVVLFNLLPVKYFLWILGCSWAFGGVLIPFLFLLAFRAFQFPSKIS